MSITRSTPKDTPVVVNLSCRESEHDDRSGEHLGRIWCVEGDAGIAWCLVQLDDPGEGSEYVHVPFSAVREQD